MSTKAPSLPTTPPLKERSQGRAYFWAGIGVCLLGLALVAVQFGLKHLFVPWYSPMLCTLGAVLLFLSVLWRRSLLRVVTLVLVAVLAGFQWYFFASMIKLPDYTGPAQPGKKLPHFQAVLANSRPFTDADLSDGSRRVMTFFRGRW